MDTGTQYPADAQAPAPQGPEATAAEVVAQAIAEWRTSAGLSRDQVSEALQIDPSQISRWETGKRIPTLERVRELAALCGVAPDRRRVIEDRAFVARRTADLAPAVRQHLASASAPPPDIAS